MATELPFTLKSFQIKKLLVPIHSKFVKGRAVTTIHPYLLGKNFSRVPFSYGRSLTSNVSSSYPRADFDFIGSLRPEQIEIIRRAFGILREHSSLILATHVGFGKTILSIYIMSQIKLKTVIVVDLVVLMDQWKSAIEKVLSNARVHIIPSGESLDFSKYDIFIVNLVNIDKIKSSVHQIGLLIADEIHSLLSEKGCTKLLYFTPKYLLGLSATPYREDESQALFDLFFDPRAIIFKPLLKSHKVYRIDTGIKIDMPKTKTGLIDWGAILKQQIVPERSKIIADIIIKNPRLTFLVLCKRVDQIKAVSLELEGKIKFEAVYGSTKVKSDSLPRVLIGTFKKLGKGFDRADFNALILASDIQRYFIQALGRVFRNPSVEPIIFDLVDDNFILKKHFEERARVYKEAGGTIL